MYFHGNGFVIINIEICDATCRAIANRSGCAVVAVNYQKAPEHKFPAAVDDAWAATKWVVEHAEELGVDVLDKFLQTCTVRQVRMLREIALEAGRGPAAVAPMRMRVGRYKLQGMGAVYVYSPHHQKLTQTVDDVIADGKSCIIVDCHSFASGREASNLAVSHHPQRK
jgi:hypothetical protein